MELLWSLILKKFVWQLQRHFEAQKRQYHSTVIDMLALRVTSDFEPKIKKELIQVEDIQDSVEKNLE